MNPEAMSHDPDSLPAPLGSLSSTATEAMIAALRQYVAHSGDVAPLRSALHTIGREARVKRIPAERLMLAFKALWPTLPQPKNAADAKQHAKQLERLITICIEEYYRE